MRFNLKKLIAEELAHGTVRNHEGEKAYALDPEMELYSAVVTSFASNKFYEGSEEFIIRVRKLVAECNPLFVAQLAVYAREKMYLRSMPLVLVTELAKIHNGDNLVSNTTAKVVARADEITELLAYYQMANERFKAKKLNKLSRQIQKGLAMAFNKFDEYQFAKYNRKASITLKDALFLVHPKAKDVQQQTVFNKIVEDSLTVPYTWETELSGLGQQDFTNEKEKARAIKNTWETLIMSGKIGYMALMRNLRNMLTAGVHKDCLQVVAQQLANPQAVKRSKQLPFRFLAAYNELVNLKLRHTNLLINALERAVLISAENIPGFAQDTRVLLASDVSGSMYMPLSKKSKIYCYDVGLMLSMLLQTKCQKVVTGIFGDRWMQVDLPSKNVLHNVQKLKSLNGKVGYSTNAYLVIENLIHQRRPMDKVLFFTDLQMWNSRHDGNTFQQAWLKYKRLVAPNAKLYLFDLAGYGNTPLKVESNDVYLIAGWSDKVFAMLEAMENGKSALQEIKQISLSN